MLKSEYGTFEWYAEKAAKRVADAKAYAERKALENRTCDGCGVVFEESEVCSVADYIFCDPCASDYFECGESHWDD